MTTLERVLVVSGAIAGWLSLAHILGWLTLHG